MTLEIITIITHTVYKIDQLYNISEFENQVSMQSRARGDVRAGKKNRGGICIKEMVTDSKGTETVEKEGAQRQNLEEKPH